ncbi:hypothetical protein B0A52_07195 [Exophiala mesophila]|uniref:Uncharacterized protein n=1 Tax=Exophiala mesophila TaxID=212818 RepID=A0A438N0G2_EXOME|nr:hypothetical protein B0A52_07195 [Exophiala mesophila]
MFSWFGWFEPMGWWPWVAGQGGRQPTTGDDTLSQAVTDTESVPSSPAQPIDFPAPRRRSGIPCFCGAIHSIENNTDDDGDVKKPNGDSGIGNSDVRNNNDTESNNLEVDRDTDDEHHRYSDSESQIFPFEHDDDGGGDQHDNPYPYRPDDSDFRVPTTTELVGFHRETMRRRNAPTVLTQETDGKSGDQDLNIGAEEKGA